MECSHCSLCRTDLLCGKRVARCVATAFSVALILFAFCAGSVWHGVCPLLALSH